jgi:hypothetical protein
MSSEIVFEDSHFTVIRDGGSDALHARVAFTPGDVLTAFRVAALVPEPTRYSIQLAASEHALVEPECLRFMNHSCDPNVALDTGEMHIRAIRPIEPGDLITYFYPSTEWSMAEPFRCWCGSARCLGEIAGAAELPPEVLAGYDLAEHISMRLQAADR